jgi:hypothetical protein
VIMERILALLIIPADKALHFIYGMVIFAVAHFLLRPEYAAAIVVVVMVAKEIYDAQHPDKHTADPWDAVAGAVGAGLGWLCTLPALILLKF